MENFKNKINELAVRGFHTGAMLNEQEVENSHIAVCENCRLYLCPDGLIFEVHGNILMKYQELGETHSELGFPRSDEMDDPEIYSGKVSYFEFGKIKWEFAKGCTVELYPYVDLDAYEKGNEPLKNKLQEIANHAFNALSENQESIKNKITKGKVGQWCGYALNYFYSLAGVPKRTTDHFSSTSKISAFGSYGRINYDGNGLIRKDYKEDTPLKQQHEVANALRKMITFEDFDQDYQLDILPGDIVLLDNSGKHGPDHIQLVYQWIPEKRMLIVIDGNGGGFALSSLGFKDNIQQLNIVSPDGITVADKKAWIEEQLGLSLVYQGKGTGRVGISCHILKPEHQTVYSAIKNEHKRVWAIVRPSILDLS